MTSDHVAPADIRIFDGMTKHDRAPGWLSSGIVWAWDLEPLRTTVSLISISENANFLVLSDDLPRAVVRLSRPGSAGHDPHVAGEVAWVRALKRDVPLRLPYFIPTRDGSDEVVLLDDAGGEWVAVATEFVAGRPLEHLDDPSPFYREIGNATAVLHRHAREWGADAGVARPSWTIPEMVGKFARWGDWDSPEFPELERALVRVAVDTALLVLADLDVSPRSWGLIHADLRPSNILVDPVSGELTIIDFDDAGYGWYLYDFAASLSFQEHLDSAPTMAAAWVEGYREVAPLDEGDLRHANALSMLRRVQMLGWTTTHREDALPPHLWKQRFSGTVEVSSRYLADELWLTRAAK